MHAPKWFFGQCPFALLASIDADDARTKKCVRMSPESQGSRKLPQGKAEISNYVVGVIKKALLNCYARNRIMSSSIRLVWACQIYAESWCGVSSSLFLTKDRALIYPISIFMRKCSIRINDQGEMTLICRIAREEKERNFFPSLSAKKGAHET